jgi:hypothetical protein
MWGKYSSTDLHHSPLCYSFLKLLNPWSTWNSCWWSGRVFFSNHQPFASTRSIESSMLPHHFQCQLHREFHLIDIFMHRTFFRTLFCLSPHSARLFRSLRQCGDALEFQCPRCVWEASSVEIGTHMFLCFSFSLFYFLSCYVGQADHKLMSLPPQPWHWDYRRTPYLVGMQNVL